VPMRRELPVIPAGTNPADDYVYTPPELDIWRDLVRKGLPAAPVFAVVCGLIWGVNGALSALYGVAIVLVNFGLAALFMAWAAKVSPTVLMAACFGGFFVRMGVVLVAVLAVKGASWVALPALLVTILVTHIGLLIWETRAVSASLAYPGLKPRPEGSLHR
jgi:hypothetical protein